MSSSEEKLRVREQDAIRLILEFFSRRDLSITQLSLERESGINNCDFSDDLLFLRQLILDGQWNDALQFVTPLETFEAFLSQKFRFIIYKHKYVELLCIRSEAGSSFQTVEVGVQDIIECLTNLEKLCLDRDEYNHLSSLLTIQDLNDDKELKNWNPNSWRLKCFNDVKPLVEKFMLLPNDNPSKLSKFSTDDRLMNLIFKGLLYETCLNTVQSKLKNLKDKSKEGIIEESVLFEPDVFNGINDQKINLNTFITSIPESFFKFFAASDTTDSMLLDIEKHDKPLLVASWSEMILSKPIKPNVFPHIDVPYRRIKAADLMSKSLSHSLMRNTQTKDLMTMSVCDIAQLSKSTLAATGFHLDSREESPDQKLFANYRPEPLMRSELVENKKHCDTNDTSKIEIEKSFDRLFQSKNVFYTSAYNLDLHQSQKMPPISEKPTPSSEDGEGDATMEWEQRVSNKTQNDSMNESYIQIWQNYQKEKTRFENAMTNNKENQEPKVKKSALKNRQESAKLASSRSSLSGTSKLVSPKNPNPESSPQYATPLKSKSFGQQQTPGKKQQQQQGPMTSTPTQRACSNFIRKESIEDDDSHSLWNSSPIVGKQSQHRFIDLTTTIITDDHSKHGIRTSSTTPVSSNYNSQFDLASVDEVAENFRFEPIGKVYDQEPIRAAEFHPNGIYYAIGSNSKLLRVFRYIDQDSLNNNRTIDDVNDSLEPEEIYHRPNYHKGGIFCMAWNKFGKLLATGSNDKTVKMLQFNEDSMKFSTNEIVLSMHDGTVRDLCFIDDLTNGSSLLLSGGAGNNKIYITDCETSTPFLSLSGHSKPILSLYTWGGAVFVSGSQDRTIRFWDLRTKNCTNFVTCPTISRNSSGGAVAAICVDPSGRLLVSGHEDSTCMLYDIRGGRVIQTFHPHSADIRTIRFSNKAYYLLTGGYDNQIVLTDMKDDLTQPLKSIVVASHENKVIQCRWHPSDFTFLSTSADKSAILWALPPN